MSDTRQHAHELIDRLADAQLNGLVQFLQTIVQPIEQEDEEIRSEEDKVAVAREWLKHHEPIPHEEVLAEFGLTMADWDRMSRTPLAEEKNSH